MNDYIDEYARFLSAAKVRYAMSDTAVFLRGIAHNPYDPVGHQALADHLREKHGESPVWDLLQRTAAGERENLWWDFCDNSTEGTWFEDARNRAHNHITPLGRHGPFDAYYHHEGAPGQSQRHVIALVPVRELRREARQYPVYRLEVPHGEEAYRLGDQLRANHGHERFGDALWNEVAATEEGHGG